MAIGRSGAVRPHQVMPRHNLSRSLRDRHRQASSDPITEYSDTKTLKAVHTSLTSRFTLPAVPGSFGATFVTTKSSTTAAASGTAIVYQVGRVVAVEDIRSSSGGVTRADATSLANAEHTLLEHSEADFSLVETSRPLRLSVIYVSASLVLIGPIFVVPRGVGRHRIRQQVRRNATPALQRVAPPHHWDRKSLSLVLIPVRGQGLSVTL